jgi:Na+/melibiose symporter-like transporter
MLAMRGAVVAILLTMLVCSIIPYDNALGVALKVGTFQMIGGVIGIVLLFLLKERRVQSTTEPKA